MIKIGCGHGILHLLLHSQESLLKLIIRFHCVCSQHVWIESDRFFQAILIPSIILIKCGPWLGINRGMRVWCMRWLLLFLLYAHDQVSRRVIVHSLLLQLIDFCLVLLFLYAIASYYVQHYQLFYRKRGLKHEKVERQIVFLELSEIIFILNSRNLYHLND